MFMTVEEIKQINAITPYTSRLKGVWFNKKGQWRACFQLTEYRLDLGQFESEELAGAAYLLAHEEYYQNVLKSINKKS
jgi:hypothetical protein